MVYAQHYPKQKAIPLEPTLLICILPLKRDAANPTVNQPNPLEFKLTKSFWQLFLKRYVKLDSNRMLYDFILLILP